MLMAPHPTNSANSEKVGHFELLFTVLYAGVVMAIFQTITAAALKSFEFLLGLTLLILVIDHWLLHYRNKEKIQTHPYFSLISVLFVLFFYAKINQFLSEKKAGIEGIWFWIWIILLFSSSFVMKRYYEHKRFYRAWDFIAMGTSSVFIWGIYCRQWTNGSPVGMTSLALAIVYILIEVSYLKLRPSSG